MSDSQIENALDAAETMLRCLPNTTTNAHGTKPGMTTVAALRLVRSALDHMRQRPEPSPHHHSDSKVFPVWVFENGSLHVRRQGYGPHDGAGHFAFDENVLNWEPHEDDSGSHVWVGVSREDLIFLRDHLNKLFPTEATP